MNLLDKVRDIFYSGTHAFKGDLEPIQDIAFLLENGYLTLHSFPIASNEEYKKILNDRAVLEGTIEAAGGGLQHVAIKILSARFLKKEKQLESSYERSYCGYFPDVMSENGEIIVECGHTQNAEKILSYFQHGGIEELIQVPYPDENEEITGHSFRPSDKENLKEFLLFLESERRGSIKNILQKRGA